MSNEMNRNVPLNSKAAQIGEAVERILGHKQYIILYYTGVKTEIVSKCNPLIAGQILINEGNHLLEYLSKNET